MAPTTRSRIPLLLASGLLLLALGATADAQYTVGLQPGGRYGNAIYPIEPWLGGRRSFGEAVGFDGDYTRLEGFLPVWSNVDDTLCFFDGRVIHFDDARDWEFNAGGGWRNISLIDGCVIGLNSFFDHRTINSDDYQQFSIGWELLAETCEARGNVYLPLGSENEVYDSGLLGLHFVGHNIQGNRIQQYQASVGGLDLEIGRTLPMLPDFNPRAYVGYYHFGSGDYQRIDGIRGRLETFVNDNITLHLAIQHDNEYDTTVSGGFTIFFRRYGGGSRLTRLIDKMGQRVVRDPAVIVASRTTNTKELLTDATTGAPLQVRHISSSAAAGGDGSIEHPFNTLNDAETMSAAGDILYAHAGSLFDGQDIALQTGQRLLGEGIPHQVTGSQGTFLLPAATGGTTLPIFRNSTDSTVQLADNSEVSGLDIRNAGDNAIAGDDVANVNVNRNVITSPQDDGVDFDNVSGTNRIVGNKITLADENGIELTYDDETVTTILIADNEIDLSGIDGVGLLAYDSSRVTLTLTGNKITRTLEDAFFIEGDDHAVVHATLSGNRFDGSGFSSVFADLYGASDLTLRVLGNELLNYDQFGFPTPGLEVEIGDASRAMVQVVGNTFDSSGNVAIGMATFDDSQLCAQVAGNTTNGDFAFLRIDAPDDVFNLEDTLGTNTFLGGALPFTHPDVTIVPAGYCGFDDP